MDLFRTLFISLFLYFATSCSSDPAATDEPKEEDVMVENSYETWWQLRDDSEFSVSFDPSPPIRGLLKIKAKASLDDWNQMFAGTVSFRTVSTERSDA